MPNKDEKARRKESVHALRDQQRQKTQAGFPAPILTLKGLFDFLDKQLSVNECDDTLRLTREYSGRSNMDERLTVEWCEQNGGFCDCEVLDNLEQLVAEAVPGYDRIGDGNGTVN